MGGPGGMKGLKIVVHKLKKQFKTILQLLKSTFWNRGPAIRFQKPSHPSYSFHKSKWCLRTHFKLFLKTKCTKQRGLRHFFQLIGWMDNWRPWGLWEHPTEHFGFDHWVKNLVFCLTWSKYESTLHFIICSIFTFVWHFDESPTGAYL